MTRGSSTVRLWGALAWLLLVALSAPVRSAGPSQQDQQADTLYHRARLAFQQGDLAGAHSYLVAAMSRWHGKADEAGPLNLLGLVDLRLGELSPALESSTKALQIARHFHDNRMEAGALANLALIHQSLGELQEALDASTRALREWQAEGDREQQAILLGNLADLYLDLGQPEEARDTAAEAIRLAHGIKNLSLEAVSLRTEGMAYDALGDFPHAWSSLERAVALSRQLKDLLSEVEARNAQGTTLLHAHRTAEARRAYEDALVIARRTGDRAREANATANLGVLAGLSGHGLEGMQEIDHALEIYRKIGDQGAVASVRQGRALVLFRHGRLAEARSEIEKALAIVEALRVKPSSIGVRASFLAARQAFYELDIDILMRLDRQLPGKGYAALAFAASERGRARALLDDLTEAGAKIRAGVNPALLARERELERRLETLRRRQPEATADPQALAAERAVLAEQIEKSSPRYASLVYARPLSLADVQGKLLDDDTALLSYTLGEEQSYLWVVRRNTMRSYPLGPGAEIEKTAQAVYRQLSVHPQREQKGRAAKNLERLGQLLLGPVAGELRHERLAVIADGALHYIPFGALPVPAPSGLRPLLLDHEVVSIPSASVLAALRHELAGRAIPSKKVAIFADAVYGSDDERVTGPRRSAPAEIEHFPRLRASRDEAIAISGLVPRDQRFLALDFAANREAVLTPGLDRYQIVHFATHAVIDTRRPELSKIVLSQVDAQGRPREGSLRGYEIYNLNLPVELVVLSACQTALGQALRGEGLVGLTRGFLYAGAPRVVVSLWSVSDRATAKLMELFYQGMLEKGLSPAAALRAAQIELRAMRGWESPYYWAGFVLQGEWRAAH